MIKPKIIIQVRGGAVEAIFSTQEIDIAIVDFDLPQNGDPAISDIYEVDGTFQSGEAHTLYQEADGSVIESNQPIVDFFKEKSY